MAFPPDVFILEVYEDDLDVREIQEESATEPRIQIRDHWVFIRWQKFSVRRQFKSQVGESTATIKYAVGDFQRTKTVIGGGGDNRYICTHDGIRPEDPAGSIMIRRQVWEFYSAFRDAPDGWNLAQ